MSYAVVGSELRIVNYTYEMADWCSNNLCFENPQYITAEKLGKWTGGIARFLVMYRREGGDLVLPFGVARKFCKEFGSSLTAVKTQFSPLSRQFYGSHINLYEYQKRAVEVAIKRRNGVIVAPCGSGKTEIGLEIASRIGGRTLWIVHTWDLANQVLERAKTRYDSFLPNSYAYGKIGGGKVDIGSAFTVATVQTLSKIDLDKIADNFDCIIVDECHHAVGSADKVTQFSKVLGHLCAPYIYGLTATPKRADGLTGCMFALIGDKICEITRDEVSAQTCPVVVRKIMTEYEPNFDIILNGDGTLNYAGLVSDIIKDNARNELIIRHLEPQSTLILTDRVEHANVLFMLLPPELRAKSAVLSGKNSTLDKRYRKNVLQKLNNGELLYVFATYKLAKEGLDVPNLRYVVFATPQKDETTVTQSAGRVGRKADGKEFGTVLDFVDNFGLLRSYERKRNGYYKKLNYNIC